MKVRFSEHTRSALYSTWLRLSGSPKAGILSELRSQVDLSAGEVASRQQWYLGALLRHARDHVPYYRRLFSSVSLVEGEDVDLVGFARLPLLTKDAIRTHFDELQSDDLQQRAWYYNTSGGSTGEPVRFIQDAYYDHHNVAAKMLFDSWSGYEPGMTRVLLWGSERDVLGGSQGVRTRFKRWLRNDHFVNTFDFTHERKRHAVETINRLRPVQVLAYVESALELARFIEEGGLNVVPPKAVMTSAGVLDAAARETIERVFRAPVFDRYGSREVGGIASETAAHNGWLVPPSIHYVEVVDEDGRPVPPGEEGEITVTVLTNYAMPLIRYRIGDRGALASEPGDPQRGILWPRLERLSGRTTDVFVRADGSTVHGAFFRHLFFYKDWIEKFQIVQEDYTFVRVYVVPAGGHRPDGIDDEVAEVEHQIRTVMGDRCELAVEFVDDIPKTASGKFRYTVSHVHS